MINYPATGSGLNEKVRSATLNACLGEDAQEILEGLAFENEGDREDADKIIAVLWKYCLGEVNETYERYNFFNRDQEQGEQVDHYIAALRSLSKIYNFEDLEDSLIRHRLVTCVTDTSTRKKLLTADKLTLIKEMYRPVPCDGNNRTTNAEHLRE